MRSDVAVLYVDPRGHIWSPPTGSLVVVAEQARKLRPLQYRLGSGPALVSKHAVLLLPLQSGLLNARLAPVPLVREGTLIRFRTWFDSRPAHYEALAILEVASRTGSFMSASSSVETPLVMSGKTSRASSVTHRHLIMVAG